MRHACDGRRALDRSARHLGNCFGSTAALESSIPTSPVRIAIPVFTGATTPREIAFDPTDTTQKSFGSEIGNLNQDGYASDYFVGFSVTADDKVIGRYSMRSSLVTFTCAMRPIRFHRKRAPFCYFGVNVTCCRGLNPAGIRLRMADIVGMKTIDV